MTGSSTSVPPPIPPFAKIEPLQLTPGFWAALRGVWSLTWRSQLTMRGLGISLAALLALPLLAYISATPLPRRPNMIGNPQSDFQRLARNFARHGMTLTAQESNAVSNIFNEEYARAQSTWSSAPTLPPAEMAQAQTQQLKDWNRRLVDRVNDALPTDKFDHFQEFQKLALTARTQEAGRVRWNASDAFYHLLVEFYFFLVLPLVCVRSCGALIRDELQADTMGFLTTRPIPRATLAIVKYVSQTAWLTALLLLQTTLLFAVGAARNVPDLANIAGIFLLAQLLATPAWSALGLLLGLFTKRYIAAALVYGFVVELGLGRIPSNINALSLMRHLKALLANNAMLRERFEWTEQAVAVPILALVIGTGLFLGVSAALFTFREYHHNGEMQK
jgi:ABC-type transport system involved in multi-copper enzyme maturation permease subunit